MTTFGQQHALQRYANIDLECEVATATPHRIAQMLMEGVLQKLAIALRSLESGAISAKGENIGRAIALVGELRASLDPERGGEIAERLDGLYGYMTSCLLEAHIRDDADRLHEVKALMSEIKEGWDALATQAQAEVAS